MRASKPGKGGVLRKELIKDLELLAKCREELSKTWRTGSIYRMGYMAGVEAERARHSREAEPLLGAVSSGRRRSKVRSGRVRAANPIKRKIKPA